ncbi:MAG TPA: hypothetical protein VK254_04945 [Candidatus Bathyarchaeia archaeon]|nr:hypothetical protein [Candidatus Bathyarchaeia archaeon]
MPISQKKRKNVQLRGDFREIFVSASRELAPFGMVFSYSPENFDARQLGTIFGIIKISDTSPESSFIANLLASVIKKEYFSKPDRPAYDSFEASLRKANLALAELARQGSVKWIGRISFAGGVLEKSNLHFSKLGSTAILLLRGGMLADIGAGLEDDAAETDSHPLKTFSDISSGKVESGDCLIFTTSDLLEIFSLEEIRQNAARFSRDEFPDILSASLTANSELSGAIVVSIVSEEEALPKIEKRPVASAVSYPPNRRFVRPSDSRRAGVAPVPAPQPAAPAEKLAARPEKNLYISETDEMVPKRSFGEKTLSASKKALYMTKNGVSAVGKQTSRIAGLVDWQKIPTSLKSASLSAAQQAKKINLREKMNKRVLMIAGIVVAVAIVSASVFKFSGKKNSPAGQPQPASPAEQTEPTSPSAIESAAEPNDVNAKNAENISPVATIPSDSREFLSMGNSLFALSGDKSILKINPANGEVEKSDSSVSSEKFMLAAAMPDLNTIFIFTADKKVISFTPVNRQFQENNIELPDNLNASDMKTYLTYLYILDSNANRIYRYPRAEGGFGSPQNWLKESADLKNTTGFGINGDMFIANHTQISAYLQGKKDEKISFENPTASLAIDKIYTDSDLENLYILDNKNRRVVQYSKSGKIVAQYFNQSIVGIKDFTVDEKSKIVYLQKADSVLKFSME